MLYNVYIHFSSIFSFFIKKIMFLNLIPGAIFCLSLIAKKCAGVEVVCFFHFHLLLLFFFIKYQISATEY